MREKHGRKRSLVFALLAAALGQMAAPLWAATDAEKCAAKKNKIAGKYYFCREKADAKGILKGLAPDYSKCTMQFDEKWDSEETKGGGTCPDNVTTAPMNAFIAAQATETAAIISGAQDIPQCGDGAINVAGEQCDGADLAGEDCTTLGFSGGTLVCDGSCGFDASGCTCGGGGGLPATGQTTAYGTGSDGDVKAGAALSYTDNGDGTITDNNTGLMWEKKDDSAGIHGRNVTYTWCGASCGGTNIMDGTISTTFLATLNGGGGFAGYSDWRIPNYKELTSILSLGTSDPAVTSAFHDAAGCTGCSDVTVATCSCTRSHYYWSSSTLQFNPDLAWIVDFSEGYVNEDFRSWSYAVRAVRGGL